MNTFKRILLGLLSVLVLVVLIFVVWGYTGPKALAETSQALQSDDQVQVETGKWLVFSPVNADVDTALILYPGGRVDPRAYAPYANALAAEGYLVIIPRMPLNLAVFGVNTAAKIESAYPEVTHWVIGGHSLGGSMAASYTYSNPAEIEGLVLLASYPAESNNLSDYQGQVLSISASLDGLATPDKIAASKALLPAQTKWVVIEGGDHAYFGWYGPQKGDNPATITRGEQQGIMVKETLILLEQVSE